MSLTIGYSWKELGASLKTTNVATIVSATNTTMIAAPGVGSDGTAVIIYQIDWDLGTGDSLTIGDNNALDGTDRIIFKSQSAGAGSRQYPNGWLASANKPIVAKTTGANVDAWVRITYMLSK